MADKIKYHTQRSPSQMEALRKVKEDDEFAEAHTRKKEEKEKEVTARKKADTEASVKEWQALTGSDDDFVPAGASVHTAGMGRQAKQNELDRLGEKNAQPREPKESDKFDYSKLKPDWVEFVGGNGVPEKPDTSSGISKAEDDFMRGKVPKIEPVKEEKETTFEEKISKGVESTEKKKEEAPPAPEVKMYPVPKKGSDSSDSPAGGSPPQRKDSDLIDRLDSAEKEYQRSKSNLDKREAIETFFNAFGRIGAGMAGRSTGTDMSGIQFDKQDWESKRNRNSKEFSDARADIRQAGRDREAERQFDRRSGQTDRQLEEQVKANRNRESLSKETLDFNKTSAEDQNTFRGEQLAEVVRHNKATESIGWGKAEMARASALSSAAANSGGDISKRSEKVRDDLDKIIKDEDASDDYKIEHVKTLLMEQLRMSPEQADQLVRKEGWFGDSLKKPEEIHKQLQPIIQAGLATQQIQGQAGKGKIAIMRDRDNLLKSLPEGQAIPEGWTVVGN